MVEEFVAFFWRRHYFHSLFGLGMKSNTGRKVKGGASKNLLLRLVIVEDSLG